ncbi:xylose operon regulatory protein [Blastopirellula marina DSM 3645]|uniref:Xylose operon regulatory protein n=1 Tax=Blastopirellula marina DSM 3645 TaxID=314230 RepID=A3ZQ62_9BACT|nr:xylose operon regulatory protein [Blastopirellula marina DSM 3645]
MNPSKPPRSQVVLLLIESSRGYGRACLHGVADYCRIHRNWQILHVERRLNEALPEAIQHWNIDGVITRIETDDVMETIDRLGRPTVDLRGSYFPQRGATFDTDHAACAEMAVEHFVERGLRDIAYCGYPGIDFSDLRAAPFERIARQHGCRTHSFVGSQVDRDAMVRELLGESETNELGKWVQSLPRPCGILGCNDVRARQVLMSCKLAGVAVPEDIALLGIDNDLTICNLVTPLLSSIEPDAHRIGYEGAASLDRLMKGEQVEKHVLIPPKSIVVRGSSDVMAIADREVAAIVHYISEHACSGLSVEMIANQFHLSRSSLDRRFQQELGRGIKSEIDRVRIDHAKALLRYTDLKLIAIAHHTSYSSAAKLVSAFKRITGVTPGAFRANWQ